MRLERGKLFARLLAGTVVVLAAASVALVRPSGAETAIRPGVGIGPVRLGMTEQAVRRVLGRPSAEQRARSGRTRILHLNYYLRGEYRVTLRGRAGALRVTLVGTISRKQKTPNGVGVGTSESRLRAAYPSSSCKNIRAGGGVIRRECRVGARTRPHSVFVIGAGPNPPVVIEVLVVAAIAR